MRRTLEPVADASGISPETVIAPADRRHDDSPPLAATLDALLEPLGRAPDRASVHPDRAYGSRPSRRKPAALRSVGETSEKGNPASVSATERWVAERADS